MLVAVADFALTLLGPVVHTDGSGLVQEGRLWLWYSLWLVLRERGFAMQVSTTASLAGCEPTHTDGAFALCRAWVLCAPCVVTS